MKPTSWPVIALLFVGTTSVGAQAPPTGADAAPPAQAAGVPPSAYAPAPPQTAPPPPVDSGRGPAPAPFPATMPARSVGVDPWANNSPGSSFCPRPPEALPCVPSERVWVDGEYLLWWVKQGPLPVPLVTTGSAAAASPGALGQPGTMILFGNSNLDYGTFSGGRLTVGTWLDHDATIGLEGQGFLLEQRSTGASFASPGQPALAVPFFNAVTGQEDIGAVATPGVKAGGVSVSSSTRLWGAESNVVVNLVREGGWTVDFLGGFRYLDLREDLSLAAATSVQPQVSGSVGDPVLLPPVPLHVNDDFATRNQFYGGQLGTRLEYRYGNVFLRLAGKVALGYTHQVVDVNGHSAMDLSSFGGPALTVPFGFFARPTNVGRYTRNEFGVVPEGELRIGYQLTPRLSAFAGYDFLYWSSVARPGQQVNRVLNQSPDTPGTPAQPAPLFRTTDFWAQGVNFGLELRF